MGIVEVVAPRRMGIGFRWLVASSWTSNLADGIALAAAPLLVASQTRNPALVALASVLQRLPWLVLGLSAGVIADRLDRRLIIVVGNLLRALVLGVLSLAIVSGQVNVWVVLVAAFVLGTAEVFVDTTSGTLLPMVVGSRDLGIGNARLFFGNLTINQLAGPPLGATLFALGMVVPFIAQGVILAAAALMIVRVVELREPTVASPTGVRSEMREGLAWLWAHPPIRTLTLTIVAFNITFGAAWSVLVLYAMERLGLGDIGFGLLTSASAAGGVLGTMLYGSLEQRFRTADLLRAGLIIETFTHLALALTTVAGVAMAVFFVFGVHTSVWGATATTIRHRAVPTAFQGRIASVYLTGLHGSMVLGAALGGVIASRWGLTGPFWFGFVGSGLILVSMWSAFTQIDADDAPAAAH